MSIIRATDKTFKDLSDGKCLLVFSSPTCGPCQIMAPTIEEIAKENADIKVIKLNVEEAPEVAGHYHVRNIPTMVVSNNGAAMTTKVGVLDKEQIIDWFHSC